MGDAAPLCGPPALMAGLPRFSILPFGPRNRLRLVRQTEAAECGLACLAMVVQYHGLLTDMGTLRRRFTLSTRGVTLRTLMRMADDLGLVGRAVKAPLSELGRLEAPAVLHWDLKHFVVLERVKNGRALIHDPAGTSRWMMLAEVSNHFSEVALELRPGARFEPGVRDRRLRLDELWTRITGLRRALVQTLVLSVILQTFVLVSPYYMQIAIDQALPALDADLLTVLAVGFGTFALINSLTTLMRAHVLLNAGSSVGYGIAVNITRRLFRLPVDWFERRHTGDVLSRFQSIGPVQQVLTEGAVAAVLDGALALMTLIIMFVYSPVLASIALLALILYTGLRFLLFSLQRGAQDASIVAIGKEQSLLLETLRGITVLRLYDREIVRHAQWQSRRVEAVNAEVKLARIGAWTGVFNVSIFGLETVVTIWIAVSLVMNGAGFSLGMVFAYMAYRQQFVQKGGALIDQIIQFRMLGLHLERLSDIALAAEDPSFSSSDLQEDQLIGRIELRGVEYRYAPGDPLVLKGIDLVIEPGEHIAITGVSGGGKSTLLKIVLGLIRPTNGEVIVDGVPLERFGYKNYQRQIAAVLQDDVLFAGSIAENIALFDDGPKMDDVRAAARAACVIDDVMGMPLQFETLVGDMGSTLSGGQKQRVILARAIYRQPTLLVMDEGTAHLDAMHEGAVNRELATLGITRLVVAHRQETIAAADQVLVLENGTLTMLTT